MASNDTTFTGNSNNLIDYMDHKKKYKGAEEMNVAALTGRLTADPELRKTQSGVSVCRFTIAVDRKVRKQGEERKADFLECVAWRGTAEFVSKYFTKGQPIAVDGEINTDTYTDKDGINRKKWYILTDNVSFCGSKNESGNQGPPTVQTRNDTPDASEFVNSSNDFMNIADDDELPF